MTNIIFSTPGKPTVSLSVEEAQTMLRKRFNDDSVDLAILSILSGKTMYVTINDVTVSIYKES